MKRIRIISLFLAALLLLSVFSGCKKEEEQAVSVRIMTVLGDDRNMNVYSSLLREYSAENVNVNIRDTSAKENNAFRLGATLASTYATLEAPHIVIYYSTTGIDQLGDTFATIEQIREFSPSYASNISLAAIENMGGCAVPLLGEWRGLIVNNELLQKVGADEITDWNSFIHACSLLKAEGYIPVANNAGDCAVLLESLVYGYGGETSVKNGLSADRITQDAWRRAFECIGELCEWGYLAPSAQTDSIVKYVSESDLTDYLGDAAQLFNSSKAAMILVDDETVSQIENRDNCTLVPCPMPDDAKNKSVFGGYNIGLYITKKAIENIEIRNTVISLAEYLINESSQQAFAQIGYMPSNVGVVCEEPIIRDVIGHFKSSGYFVLSARTAANRSSWEALEILCAQLSYEIITPEQATELWFDKNISIEDLLFEEVVSASDVPVSPSDAESD